MPDLYDPFQTWVAEHPDFNYQDQRRAVEQQLLRDDQIRAYLAGQTELDVVLDSLAETGLDPDLWLLQAADGAERIVDNGIEFYRDETGLLLPR